MPRRPTPTTLTRASDRRAETPAPDLYPHVTKAIRYARQVVTGEIDTGSLTKLAAQRFLDDIEAADAETSDWEFRRDLAERPCRLAELLPNIKGTLAGKPLVLLDWQCLVYVALYGFVYRGTTRRRFTKATVWVPRGNGKSTVVTPLALFGAFVEGEGGAEVYAAAGSRDQAKIVFDVAKNMLLRSPKFCARYGVHVGAHAILQSGTASVFRPLSRDAGSLDGLNVHVAIVDEIGSHKSPDLYEVLETAIGKRDQPLLLSISTATGNGTGVGRQTWDYGVRVLKGEHEDETFFALMYHADEDDDPWDEATWIKANPSWGIAVRPDQIAANFRSAKGSPAKEAAMFTRHLNRWVGTDDAFFSISEWQARGDDRLNLADFEGEECHLGLDLAATTDLASMAIVFPKLRENGSLEYTVFSRHYLNREAVKQSSNASYAEWASSGALDVSEGNENDLSDIEDDVLEMCSRFNVVSVAFDSWQGRQMMQRLAKADVPVVEFKASTANYSPATLELDGAMRGGRLQHDDNPVLNWCIGNVVGHIDARGNVYPKKARRENKIDGAIAAIMAVARCVAEPPKPKRIVLPYDADNGLLFV